MPKGRENGKPKKLKPETEAWMLADLPRQRVKEQEEPDVLTRIPACLQVFSDPIMDVSIDYRRRLVVVDGATITFDLLKQISRCAPDELWRFTRKGSRVEATKMGFKD
jgi:hypothetical protein